MKCASTRLRRRGGRASGRASETREIKVHFRTTAIEKAVEGLDAIPPATLVKVPDLVRLVKLSRRHVGYGGGLRRVDIDRALAKRVVEGNGLRFARFESYVPRVITGNTDDFNGERVDDEAERAPDARAAVREIVGDLDAALGRKAGVLVSACARFLATLYETLNATRNVVSFGHLTILFDRLLKSL